MLKKKKPQPRLGKSSAEKGKKAAASPIAKPKETPAETTPPKTVVVEGKEGVGKISHRPIVEEINKDCVISDQKNMVFSQK